MDTNISLLYTQVDKTIRAFDEKLPILFKLRETMLYVDPIGLVLKRKTSTVLILRSSFPKMFLRRATGHQKQEYIRYRKL